MALAAPELRNGLLLVQRGVSTDLAALFREVTSAAEARQALGDLLPDITRRYGDAAAAMAADWYDAARVKAEVPGSFQSIPAQVKIDDLSGLARVGSAPLVGESSALQTALSLVVDGVGRRVAQAARETVMGSSIADPQARGWQRDGVGACAFCRMLISRGAVYSEASVDFGAHVRCRCTAVPAFSGAPRPVRPFTPSLRRYSDADKARVRRYLRENFPDE